MPGPGGAFFCEGGTTWELRPLQHMWQPGFRCSSVRRGSHGSGRIVGYPEAIRLPAGLVL